MTSVVSETPRPYPPRVARGRDRRAASPRSTRTAELFSALLVVDTAEVSGTATTLLAEVISLNVPVADSVARRFEGRGIELDDLRGVARVGLVKAARRFDVLTGHDFLSFAVPTITGEIKRYFRDLGWMVRPPRRIQELQGQITAAQATLAVRLGRPAVAGDLAGELEVDSAEIDEALAANGCFRAASLDAQVGDDPGSATFGELFGAPDPGFVRAEARASLGPALRALCDEERRLIGMRFFEGLNQREIGEHLGMTQAQVSRQLARLLTRMRGLLEAADDSPVQPDHARDSAPARAGT